VTTLGSDDLRRMFAEIDSAIAAERDELCRLDGEIGDADHGIAMASGFAAIRQALGALDAAGDLDRRYHADPAQRLPPAEAPARLADRSAGRR